MRVISIGREPQCNIYINDARISRRHALLKVHANGKMELVDIGSNGTFVNGVKLTPNVPFPVKRSQDVSFANAAILDWDVVPNPLARIAKIAAGVLCLILLAGGIACFSAWNSSRSKIDIDDTVIGGGSSNGVVLPDTTRIKSTESQGSNNASAENENDDDTSWYDETIRKDKEKKQKNESPKSNNNDAKGTNNIPEKDNEKAKEEVPPMIL